MSHTKLPISHVLLYVVTVCIWLAQCNVLSNVLGRQAIPIAIVQGDTLASAKHTSKSSNTTNELNCTTSANHPNSTCSNEIEIPSYQLFNSTTFIKHDTNNNSHSESKTRRSQQRHVEMKITGLTFHNAEEEPPTDPNTNFPAPEGILVGPLDVLPEHPHGNGPQEKQSKTIKIANKSAAGGPSKSREKRQFPLVDDDDDSSPFAVDPPMFEGPIPDPNGFIHRDVGDEERRDEMPNFRLIGIEPHGLWQRSFPPLPPLSPNVPAPMDGEGPDLYNSQRDFERRRFWQPYRQAPLSFNDQLEYGEPDRNYQRSIEDEANRVEEKFAGTMLQSRMSQFGDDPVTGSRRSYPGDNTARGVPVPALRPEIMRGPYPIGQLASRSFQPYNSPIGLPPGPSRFTQMLNAPLMEPDGDEYPTKSVPIGRARQPSAQASIRPNAFNLLISGTLPVPPDLHGSPFSNGLPMAAQQQDRDHDYPAFINPMMAASMSNSQTSRGNSVVKIPWPTRLLDRRAPPSRFNYPNGYSAQQMIAADRRQRVNDAANSASFTEMFQKFYGNMPIRSSAHAPTSPRSNLAKIPVYSIRTAGPSGMDPHNAVQYAFLTRPLVNPANSLSYHPAKSDSVTSKQSATDSGKPASFVAEQDPPPFVKPKSQTKHVIARTSLDMMSFSADSAEDKNHGKSKIVDVLQHKDILSIPNNLKKDASGIMTSSNDGKNVSSEMVNHLQTAIKDVLGESVRHGNMTQEQANHMQERITTILHNRTVAKQNISIKAVKESAPVFTKHTKSASIDCKDQFKECKRFHDAGICPFLSSFMASACAKTCDGCRNSTRKGEVAKPLLQLIRPADSVPSNPIMHLTFGDMDSSEMIKDHSGNNNNAELLNGAKVSRRKLGTCGRAAELNGGDLSWQSKDLSSLPLTAVTLAMWVKSKRTGSFTWFRTSEGSKITFESEIGTKIPAKVWTHIAGTYDSETDLARVYIDGDLMEERELLHEANLIEAWLKKGVSEAFSDSNLRYVDEVYLYPKALNVKDVKKLANNCQFNRMVIHYGFQRSNDTKVYDQSGLENDAIVSEGARLKSNCERCGSCLDLTSKGHSILRIQRVAVKSLPTRSVSIAAWLSLENMKGTHNVFTTRNAKQPYGYHLAVVDGRIEFSIAADNGDVIFNATSTNVIVPETLWTHVLVTYSSDSGMARIYTNGAQKFNLSVPLHKRTLPLPIDWDGGANVGGDNFRGEVDEFLLYNWSLESSEAIYVRDYCAEQPKLVRFTVRVPLTKRNHIQQKKTSI